MLTWAPFSSLKTFSVSFYQFLASTRQFTSKWIILKICRVERNRLREHSLVPCTFEKNVKVKHFIKLHSVLKEFPLPIHLAHFSKKVLILVLKEDLRRASVTHAKYFLSIFFDWKVCFSRAPNGCLFEIKIFYWTKSYSI